MPQLGPNYGAYMSAPPSNWANNNQQIRYQYTRQPNFHPMQNQYLQSQRAMTSQLAAATITSDRVVHDPRNGEALEELNDNSSQVPMEENLNLTYSRGQLTEPQTRSQNQKKRPSRRSAAKGTDTQVADNDNKETSDSEV